MKPTGVAQKAERKDKIRVGGGMIDQKGAFGSKRFTSVMTRDGEIITIPVTRPSRGRRANRAKKILKRKEEHRKQEALDPIIEYKKPTLIQRMKQAFTRKSG